MWMNMRIRIKFATVLHGWMPIGIYLDSESLNFIASYTPRDAISELARSLLCFLTTNGTYIVTFREGPAQYDFSFTREGERGKFKVIRYSDYWGPDYKREPATGEELISVSEGFINIALPFWRGLRELKSRVEREGYEEQWRWPFPHNEVEQLDQKLGKLKVRSDGV
jgi:hypothetical protein